MTKIIKITTLKDYIAKVRVPWLEGRVDNLNWRMRMNTISIIILAIAVIILSIK